MTVMQVKLMATDVRLMCTLYSIHSICECNHLCNHQILLVRLNTRFLSFNKDAATCVRTFSMLNVNHESLQLAKSGVGYLGTRITLAA